LKHQVCWLHKGYFATTQCPPAVKLEPNGFPVEVSVESWMTPAIHPVPSQNIIADCMELLLPMAAKKLDLAFNIDPDVPAWVYADYDRIRQGLWPFSLLSVLSDFRSQRLR
jgi:hypothetical protein